MHDTPTAGESPFADEHRGANASALGHYAAFAGHRARLTELVVRAAPASEPGSLCVLGAGNCFDLALDTIAKHYAQLHLVDVDEAALRRAADRQTPTVRSQITTHAPVDLSGMHHRLNRWARGELTPEELVTHTERTAVAVAERLDRTFDVVVSACMLSQMQLDVVQALGDRHPLLHAVSWTLTVAHLRTLAALTKNGGTALFATDVTGSPIFPLAEQYECEAGLSLLASLARDGRVFDFAHPGRIEALLHDDPALRAAFPSWTLADAWVWQNGPDMRFLVYGASLTRAR